MVTGGRAGAPTAFCWNRAMCTAILGVSSDGTVLLAGVRDEFTQRAWQPPARHWPDRPGLIGGRGELGGGRGHFPQAPRPAPPPPLARPPRPDRRPRRAGRRHLAGAGARRPPG